MITLRLPWWAIIISALTIIILDQLSKYLVVMYYPSLVFINKQGLLGLIPAYFTYIAMIFLLLFIIYQRQLSILLITIAAAGLSNVSDRYFYGGVVDFIHIWEFPVFNLADTVITFSIIALLIKELLHNEKY